MKIEIYYIFSLIAFFQASFLILYLLLKKTRGNIKNRLFAIILTVFALLIVANFMNSASVAKYFMKYHKFVFIIRQLTLILIPLLYFYIRAFFQNIQLNIRQLAYHFSPFILFVIYLLFILIPVKNFNVYTANIRYTASAISLSQNVIYLFLSVRMVKTKSLFNNFKKPDATHLNWVNALIIGFLFLWIIQFNSFILVDIMKLAGWCPYTSSLYFIAAFIVINIIMYMVMDNPALLQDEEKYSYSRLTPKDMDSIFSSIHNYLSETQKFCEPEYTLDKLANELSMPVKSISQAINYKTQRNFKDYINKLRIEECGKLLAESQKENLTISEIFYSAGFNSKSIFNTYFKKTYGVTPTQFREENGSKTGYGT